MRDIYVLRDSEGGVRYVGCSNNARRRWKDHWRYRLTKNTPCAVWLRSLETPPDWDVVETVDNDVADAVEREWIATYREIVGDNLLNVTTGGASYRRTKPRPSASAETRALISAAHRGRRVSEETRKIKSLITTQKWREGVYDTLSDETRTKKSESMKKVWANKTPEERSAWGQRGAESRRGQKHSPEAREKMRRAALGRAVSAETREKMRKAHTGSKWSEERRAAFQARKAKRQETVSDTGDGAQ